MMSNAAYQAIRQSTTYVVQERRLPGSRPEQLYTLVISLGKIEADVEHPDDCEARLQCPVVSFEEGDRRYEEFCLYQSRQSMQSFHA
ncbi:MAG: hypothetical protein WBA10_08095 [Elainellaceae cyanobacterium]